MKESILGPVDPQADDTIQVPAPCGACDRDRDGPRSSVNNPVKFGAEGNWKTRGFVIEDLDKLVEAIKPIGDVDSGLYAVADAIKDLAAAVRDAKS